MAALFMLGVGLVSAITGGVSAANNQKKICEETDKTYQQIQTYSSAQQKLAAQLQSYDSDLKSQIADQLDSLASINANLASIQSDYKNSYRNLEIIIIITCIMVGILLVLKRLGFLTI